MAGIADTLHRWGTAASSSKLGGILYHVVCRRIDTVLIPLTKGRLSMGPPGIFASRIIEHPFLVFLRRMQR